MEASFESRAEQLANEFAGQATTVEELNDLMRLMMKSGLEGMLDTEMDVHLGRRLALTATATVAKPAASPTGTRNRRNGHSPKTLKGDLGEVTIDTPRDRNSTFEPQLIEKHQRRLPGFDEKILALYAKEGPRYPAEGISAIESVTSRLISSGIVRSKLRRPTPG